MNYSDIEKRLGCIEVTKAMIKMDPQSVMMLMSKIIILHCEFIEHLGKMRYTCVSPFFDLVPQGGEIPFYIVLIDESGFVFHRVNKNNKGRECQR